MALVQNLHAFGAAYKNIEFDGFWDWFVHVEGLSHHLKYQPTYLIAQFTFLLGAVLTLIHALVRGGRLPYLWLGTLLHGLVIESVCYFLPDIDNFWHSQTPIIFLGRRLPLHIIVLYPCFIYNASIAVSKMKLPAWSEPFAVGLGSVLIDIPYDIMSVNFLHWTWHDTDPNIGDRHYWVPWNSYYFHACFAASFTFWFHTSRKFICKPQGKWIPCCVESELASMVIACLLGMPGGVLLFLPIYHPLHDIFKLHSENTFFILFTIFLLLIWLGDRKAKENTNNKSTFHWSTWLLIFHLTVHYLSFLAMALFFNAEDEVSIGLKEPIGACDKYVPIQTAFGMTLQKRKYLCATDYDEKYFDWHCLPEGKPPADGSSWYTACGVPLPNRAEYIAITSLICLLATTVWGTLHFCSYGDDVLSNKSTQKQAVKKMKTK